MVPSLTCDFCLALVRVRADATWLLTLGYDYSFLASKVMVSNRINLLQRDKVTS